MKKIAKKIYLENTYAGVTIGILNLKRGILIVDSPLKPEDGYSLQASLRSMGIGKERMLINLDPHPDRTIGNRAMNANIVAHDLTSDAIRDRPAVFKAQNPASGTEWEECSGLSGIRWLPPNLVFSDRMILNWGNYEVAIEHHPGPDPGAAWVVIPEQKMVFVGDAVVTKQPPLLANADINAWVESLDLLLSKTFSNFTVVSARSGPVAVQAIHDIRKFLINTNKRLERLARRKALPEATEKLVPSLLEKLKFTAKRREMYTNRMRYGLYQYYSNHYRPALSPKKK